MYQCKNCFEFKPPEEYHKAARNPSGHKAVCKACRAIRAKELSYRRDFRVPLALQRAEVYLLHLFKRAAKEARVEVPVKLINNFVPLEKGCVIKLVEGRKRCLIRTVHGPIDYPFDALNPKILLDILSTHQIKVILPGEQKPKADEGEP